MGAAKEQGINDRVKRQRGATNNGSRLAGLGGDKSKHRVTASWDEVDVNMLVRFVYMITDSGGAVRFGRSRDGAVLSVGLYLDGDSVTLWLDGEGSQDDRFRRICVMVAERLERD